MIWGIKDLFLRPRDIGTIRAEKHFLINLSITENKLILEISLLFLF